MRQRGHGPHRVAHLLLIPRRQRHLRPSHRTPRLVSLPRKR
jgi:hypothetical protein